jgi:hypothetical protein
MKNTFRKSIGFLLLAAASPFMATACEVCVGNPEDPQTKGMNAAIITMLIVTYGLLMTIIGFFVYLRLKKRQSMFVDIHHARSI